LLQESLIRPPPKKEALKIRTATHSENAGPLWDGTLAVNPPKEPFKRGYTDIPNKRMVWVWLSPAPTSSVESSQKKTEAYQEHCNETTIWGNETDNFKKIIENPKIGKTGRLGVVKETNHNFLAK